MQALQQLLLYVVWSSVSISSIYALVTSDSKVKEEGEAQLKDMHAIQEQQFAALDHNGDGKVHAHEVEATRKKLQERKDSGKGILEKFEDSLLSKISKDHQEWHGKQDKNSDGHFTLDEYKIKTTTTTTPKFPGFSKEHAEEARKTMQEQFKVLDNDGDGKVSIDEFHLVRNKLKARKDAGVGQKLSKTDDSLLQKLEHGKEKNYEDMHTKRDKDGDGYLSLDEFVVDLSQKSTEL